MNDLQVGAFLVAALIAMYVGWRIAGAIFVARAERRAERVWEGTTRYVPTLTPEQDAFLFPEEGR